MISKHSAGICPICGSSNISYEEFNLDDAGGSYNCRCLNCGASFKEAYNFVFDDQYDIEKGVNYE